ncbi:MAG: Lrp/AsnC family transcriptional regulator, partial [Candidatus Thorarchaeota archaeon]
EVCSAGMTHSFYHYNTSTHKWNIPWSAMRGWGTRIHEEGLDVLLERIDTPPSTTDAYLDELDMQIMVNVQHGFVTTRDLRRNLAVGQRQLLSRLKKLRNAGLIAQYWNVRNVGLNEQVAIRVPDSRVGRMVDMWCRELPRNFVRYGERKDLFLVADLPIGASARMMDTLRILKWPVTVSPLGSGVWGNWPFPAELWDVSRQRWQAPIDILSSWLEALNVDSEKAVGQAAQEQRGEFASARSSAWSLQNT